MQLIPTLVASALLVLAADFAAAASSTRIAETGGYVLGNAHRCGVPDERVVRAGKVIRELIVATTEDEGERKVAKSRFAEIFRTSARLEAEGHAPAPACKAVMTQFERLEQFRQQVGMR